MIKKKLIILKTISDDSKSKLSDKEWLYNEYVILRRSINDLARELSVCGPTVRSSLVNFNIAIRSTTKGQKLTEKQCKNISDGHLLAHLAVHPEKQKHTNKDWLYDQYITQNKSALQIERELGYNVNIGLWLRKFGIKVRTRSEALSGSKNPSFGKKASIETRRKMSETRSGENNPNFGKHLSEETKKKISDSHKNEKNFFYKKHHTEETKRKISESHSGKNNPFYGRKHSEETKIKISEGGKGREVSFETRQKLSENRKHYLLDHPTSLIKNIRSNGKWYNRLDGSEIWLRSSYEVRVAIMLDKLNTTWIYEPEAFIINDNKTTYRPDFYLPDLDVWWEIKGWMDDNSRYKINSFINKYPDRIMRILKEDEIKKLELLDQNSDMYDIINIGKDKPY